MPAAAAARAPRRHADLIKWPPPPPQAHGQALRPSPLPHQHTYFPELGVAHDASSAGNRVRAARRRCAASLRNSAMCAVPENKLPTAWLLIRVQALPSTRLLPRKHWTSLPRSVATGWDPRHLTARPKPRQLQPRQHAWNVETAASLLLLLLLLLPCHGGLLLRHSSCARCSMRPANCGVGNTTSASTSAP